MNRRSFLELLATGVAGHMLDVDRLLWVPNAKKIFLPSESLVISEHSIVAAELDRIMLHLNTIFDRNDMFYKVLKSKSATEIVDREMRIPIEIRQRKK